MTTSSNGNIFRVIGHLCEEFTGLRWSPRQRPVTRNFDIFFDLRLNKRLSKQTWGWWFETPSQPLWRHSNVFISSSVTSMVMTFHCDDVVMGAMASQITSLTIVYSIVYSGTDQRKHQSSASLAFVRGIHQGPVNSPHKGPVTRKMFPFDDVIIYTPVFGFGSVRVQLGGSY